MDQYTKIMLTIITVCIIVVTLIIVGSVIVHDHDGEYHEYMEHVIERLENIEERID